MKFKQWYILNERPQAALAQPLRTAQGEIVMIDMRSEDWIIENNDESTLNFKRQLEQIAGYPPFYGLVPGTGQYIHHNGQDHFNYEVLTQPPGLGQDLDNLALEGSWWDYVQGWGIDNKVIKSPKRARVGEPVAI